MFTALNSNGTRIGIYNALESCEDMFVCPYCKGYLIIKRGSIRAPHFAHKSIASCSDEPSKMSEWHLEWQEKIPIECREIYLENSIGIVHRADAVVGKYVLEFQNSPLSADEFFDRNYFYSDLGYKVIWIFNMIDVAYYGSRNITCYDEWENKNDNGAKLSWKYAWKTFSYYSPQYDKNVTLILQMKDASDEDEDCYLERVTWAIQDGNRSDFKRFFTSYYPSNFMELMDWVMNQRF